jgi:RNA polymerase primary sigma factor
MRNNVQMAATVEANRILATGANLGGSEAHPTAGGSRQRSPGQPPAPRRSRTPDRNGAETIGTFDQRHYEPLSVLTLYMREIGRVGLLTRQEEGELARRVQRGDAAAREQMIKANLRLVVKIARDFDHMGVPLLDLISEGNIGLMRAVERYDPDRGAKLSVYASFWIKQQIRRAIQAHSRTIRVPAYCQEKLQCINRVALRLQELLGREPTNEEIAFEADLPTAKVQQVREAAQAIVSLEEPSHTGDDRELAESVADDNAASPYEALAHAGALDQLQDLLEELTPKERAVLQARFGLAGQPERSLQEIGQEVGLTRERVRQIQNGALAKLRELIRKRESASLAA